MSNFNKVPNLTDDDFINKALESMRSKKKPASEKKKLVTLQLPVALYLQVKDLAYQERVTATSVYIEALEALFEGRKKK